MTNDSHHVHIDIESREIAKDAARKSESNDERLDKLELKVKSLSVINEALYEILVAKLNLTEIELTAMIAQVAVNRVNRMDAKSTCRSCGRLVPSNKQKCMYCGGALLGEVNLSPFDQ